MGVLSFFRDAGESGGVCGLSAHQHAVRAKQQRKGPRRRAGAGKHAAPAGAASMTQIQQGFIIRRQRADASHAAQRAGVMRGDIQRMSGYIDEVRAAAKNGGVKLPPKPRVVSQKEVRPPPAPTPLKRKRADASARKNSRHQPQGWRGKRGGGGGGGGGHGRR